MLLACHVNELNVILSCGYWYQIIELSKNGVIFPWLKNIALGFRMQENTSLQHENFTILWGSMPPPDHPRKEGPEGLHNMLFVQVLNPYALLLQTLMKPLREESIIHVIDLTYDNELLCRQIKAQTEIHHSENGATNDLRTAFVYSVQVK